VTYGSEKFLAVGADGTVLMSPDGTNWSFSRYGQIPEPAKVETPAPAKVETVKPAPAKPAPAKKTGTWYKIRWGDTLWDISIAYYRTPWLYKTVAKANKIRNPDRIISGTWIYIPPR